MPESPPAVWPPPPGGRIATPARPASRGRRCVAAIAAVLAIATLSALVVAWVVIGPRLIRVQGHAMSPTLQDRDRVIFVRLREAPRRGAVVALRYPRNPAKSFVMRVVGLPGERVSITSGVVSIDGRPIDEPYLLDANRVHDHAAPRRLGPQEYFVLGDNRRNASDSREWGPVTRGHIWATMHSIIARGI